MEITLDGINSRLHIAEEKISEIKGKTIENNQNETQRGKNNLKSIVRYEIKNAIVLCFKPLSFRNSLAVQWLGLRAFTAKGPGSIPGRGTKIPQTTWHGKEKKKPLSFGVITYMAIDNVHQMVLEQLDTHVQKSELESTTGYPRAKKWTWIYTSHTIHKN